MNIGQTFQQAGHTHGEEVGARLYLLKDDTFQVVKECQWCLPKSTYRMDYYTLCILCGEYTLLVEGSHVYCDLCGICTGKSLTHNNYHLAGECKICTFPEQTQRAHRYCNKCKTCIPEDLLHVH